jgi:prepilin-type N-terminal cleavage/methylation domain-containing protein
VNLWQATAGRPTRRRPAGQDGGFSLIEVLISMSIMSVVLVIVTGAIIQIYSADTRTESTSIARDQLTNSFRRLDRELRYANWISAPGQVGTAWYLEYALPTGCRQLTFDGGVLTTASWNLPGTTPGTATTIATDLSLSGTTPPFTRYAPGSAPYAAASAGTAGVGSNFAPEHTQVRLQFNAAVGKVTVPFDVVFTAQNTSRLTSALNDCSKGRPAP